MDKEQQSIEQEKDINYIPAWKRQYDLHKQIECTYNIAGLKKLENEAERKICELDSNITNAWKSILADLQKIRSYLETKESEGQDFVWADSAHRQNERIKNNLKFLEHTGENIGHFRDLFQNMRKEQMNLVEKFDRIIHEKYCIDKLDILEEKAGNILAFLEETTNDFEKIGSWQGILKSLQAIKNYLDTGEISAKDAYKNHNSIKDKYLPSLKKNNDKDTKDFDKDFKQTTKYYQDLSQWNEIVEYARIGPKQSRFYSTRSKKQRLEVTDPIELEKEE